VTSSDDFYNQLGGDYDTIIDWEDRLAREGPFLRRLFGEHGVHSVLDTACGTGEHAAAFSSWGYEVVGCDISEEMLATCRRKYGDRDIAWAQGAFGSTYSRLGRSFDGVTCLGNSFPHVLTDDDARLAMEDFARLLRPGGILVVQQLNYRAMALRGERFWGPQRRPTPDGELLFVRIFDLGRSPLRFTILKLARSGDSWSLSAAETEHRAWTTEEMTALASAAGLTPIEQYGAFDGRPFDARSSDQMILVAQRPR